MGNSKKGGSAAAPDRIGSREYKLILASDRFENRNIGALAYREIIEHLVARTGTVEPQDDAEEERTTWYLDTPAHEIDRAGFMLRVRHEQKGVKVTLKHRSPDRCIAAMRDVTSPRGNDKAKFEEDIVPRFRTIFSRSNSLKFDKPPKMTTLGDASDLFPGLKRLAAPKAPLSKVNGFEAYEVFRDLCVIDFGPKPKVKVGLSFWYHSETSRWPLIAECAMDFEVPGDGDFPLEVIEDTNSLFQALQAQAGWFNLEATTKTRFVYDGLS